MDDPRLDLESEEFDPLLSLYSDQVKMPCPNAKPMNNLSEYISSYRKVREAKNNPGPSTSKSRLEKSQAAFKGPSTARRRYPEPADSLQKISRNVLKFMEGSVEGPLAVLHRCMQERSRVKVWTRGAKRIRGFCTGYLLAFDKHWNMALADVDETYTPCHQSKTMILGGAVLNVQVSQPKASETNIVSVQKQDECIPGTSNIPSELNKEESLKPKCVSDMSHSETNSTSTTMAFWKKRERGELPVKCRHVNQLFLRGDNVVLVSVLLA